MISTFFTTVFFQPLYNLLVILYVIIPDFGIVVVLITLIIRLALLPIVRKSIESQKTMQEIQPELKKLQNKYKNDKALQGQKVLEFYKEKKINPASGCLPLVVQLAFLITLYRVFILALNATPEGIEKAKGLLYSFTKDPGLFDPITLGFFDLSNPSIPLTIVAAGLQFIQTKMMMRNQKAKQAKSKEVVEKKDTEEPDFSTIVQNQMLYVGPVMTLVIGFRFPSGLLLYWTVTTIFMIVQQWFVLNEDKKETKKV